MASMESGQSGHSAAWHVVVDLQGEVVYVTVHCLLMEEENVTGVRL